MASCRPPSASEKFEVTPEQRATILKLLSEGIDRRTIAQLAHVSPNQVSAVMAHRTMGTYGAGELQLAVPAASPAFAPRGIFLGYEQDSQALASWDVASSANPHLLIVGESGFGKTYTIQGILSEFAKCGLAAIIFDYGQGFDAVAVDANVVDVGRSGIALNPLSIHASDLHGPISVAQRLADSFSRVYPRIGVQQHAILRSAILDVFSDAGISEDIRTWRLPPPPLRRLKAKLSQLAQTGDATSRRLAASVASHIATLFVFDVFRPSGTTVRWKDLLSRRVTLLQFRGLEQGVAKLATEFLLWNLIQDAEAAGPQSLRGFLVLDEAHRLSAEEGSPVERLLREARKFGIGLILASQQPEDFSPVAIGNTATKLVFQVTDARGSFARILGRKARDSNWANVADVITRLPRGFAYFLTGNIGRVVRIATLEERR